MKRIPIAMEIHYNIKCKFNLLINIPITIYIKL